MDGAVFGTKPAETEGNWKNRASSIENNALSIFSRKKNMRFSNVAISRRATVSGLIGLTALALLPAAQAKGVKAKWPTAQPIVLVSSQAPGGTTDLLSRLLAGKLQERLGTTVIVEHREGAEGRLAANSVSKATPDGYTFLVASSEPLVLAGALDPDLPYKAATDFTPVSALALGSFALAVNEKAGLNSVADVVTTHKEGKITFGSTGLGTQQYWVGEMFNAATGAKIRHVPYKNTSALLKDLHSGEVVMAFENPALVQFQMKAGGIKVLGVTGAQRSAIFPEVPTLAESGVTDFEAAPWYGLLAPAGLPKAIRTRVYNEVQVILKSTLAQTRLNALGAEPLLMKPAAFQKMIASDTQKWAATVQQVAARAKAEAETEAKPQAPQAKTGD